MKKVCKIIGISVISFVLVWFMMIGIQTGIYMTRQNTPLSVAMEWARLDIEEFWYNLIPEEENEVLEFPMAVYEVESKPWSVKTDNKDARGNTGSIFVNFSLAA